MYLKGGWMAHLSFPLRLNYTPFQHIFSRCFQLMSQGRMEEAKVLRDHVLN